MINEKHILKSDIILRNLYKISKRNAIRNISIFLIFLLLYPILLYFLSKQLNVWKGIDYSLSMSLTTYVGDIFLGVIVITIISFYVLIPNVINDLAKKKTIQSSNKVFEYFDKIFMNKNKNFILIIIFSFLISLTLHIFWWTDGIFGWTEISLDKPSYLGIIHFFLHFIMTYIVTTFIWNVIRLKKLLDLYNNKINSGDLTFKFDLYCIKKSGGFVGFAKLFLKGLLPILFISFYMVITIITLNNFAQSNDIEVWTVLEYSFVISGYILILYFFSKGIIQPINKILIRHKNNELTKLSKMANISFSSNAKMVNHYKLIDIIQNYPTLFLNKHTLISSTTLKTLVFVISQILVFLYRVEIITFANNM